MRTLGCFLLASSFLLQSFANDPTELLRSPGAKAAQSLSDEFAQIGMLLAKRNAELSDGDLELLIKKAHDFSEKHKGGEIGIKARKVEALAILRLKAHGKRADVDKGVDRYINDASIPSSDRFDVAAYSKHIELTPDIHKTKADVRLARTKNARFLIAKFPDDERGHKMLFGLAASMFGGKDFSALNEIVSNPATPEAIRTQAEKLILRQGFNVSQIKGLDLRDYRGRPIAIYMWTAENPKILELIQRIKDARVVFVSINIDQNPLPAKSLIEVLKVPGPHFFDGHEGEIAKQLREIGGYGIYFFDETGATSELPRGLSALLPTATETVSGGPKK